MPKYRIYIQATVSDVVEVEAEDKYEAMDLALEHDENTDQCPYELMDTRHNYYDVGDWYIADENADVEEIKNG